MWHHGFILGKFYPPHNGHLHLIREAKKLCDRLTVLLAALPTETIPGILRYECLQNLVNDPKIRVLFIENENPQYPEEHSNFWMIWKQTIESAVKEKIDVVFTSENYGEPLSKVLSAEHVCVDLERQTFPISATKIRNEPSQYWNFIPALLKPFFLKRIVLTGTESVGKSTLSQILAKHFQTLCIPEFARTYLDEKGRYVIYEDILEIGKGHLISEIQAAQSANRILFLDTDHITTKIYSEHYFQNCPEPIRKLAHGLHYDHSLFLDIDVPWVEDPQRDLGDLREVMKQKFLEEMKLRNRSFTLVQGNFKEREKQAISIVERILKEPFQPDYFTIEQRNLRNPQLIFSIE
ncbi:putative nicotinamide-nucleotide adenylyltransferase [Leptospira ryugenii]|uniref:Putative nicotinamide-nucleotide adenylyltransferase n=1 Tax=Leptospira ryugenii TaxID=1917863 RepID=A0A2P2E1R4_9LEPT|nr:AAA family ATPase [Leptospira ryugenii]GBF50811.1 putative nicotinamide-nucleotide adenylyltransferase [Leptospira ryugenii]